MKKKELEAEADPARVARYAEAAMEVLDASPLSAAMSHGYAFGVAEAVVAVADEEHAALVAERDRLRDDVRVLDLQHDVAVSGWNGMRARAEAAEAKVAKVEALADEWERMARAGDRMVWTNPLGPSLALRATLADEDTE